MSKAAKRKTATTNQTRAWTWTVLSIIVAVALAVGACALWLPDRAPSLLAQAHAMRTGPAAIQQYTDAKEVNVIPVVAADREILSNSSGVVTTSSDVNELRSGATAFTVNNRAVIALHTETPLYRSIQENDEGQDVLALNNELARLGYASSLGSTKYTAATKLGWKQLMLESGTKCDGQLDLADTLWIPEETVSIAGWTAQQGTVVNQGAPVGKIPGGLVKMTVRNGQPSDRDRTITICNIATTLPANSIDITDGKVLADIAASEAYRNMQESDRAAGISAKLMMSEPFDVLRVPAAAVFNIEDTKACIAVQQHNKLEPIAVTIVNGELGTSYVQAENADTGAIHEVVIGPELTTLKCR
ncbi:peptidoglycan-binding domain 1 protein [Bifidobacterium dolichotidis]|uniref:Peptidoglycan-binding domain 1 protein n=1 Tax=Bifidobacterium dolichotidis TaxID=2306976 RepID=A0A430FTE8_9BIFI|nr:hypothetical protein [Bifidobacterium dolichotidis]RSX56149.1 peptidoglycan-binding domain 1 protein [Bifidobacterium dolichotidis]